MIKLSELIHGTEYQVEDPVNIIEAPDSVKKGELANIRAIMSEKISEPHKREHHKGWIALFYRPDGEKFPFQLGKTEFSCREEAGQDIDIDSVSTTHQELSLTFKATKSGTIFATSSCDFHGMGQVSKELKVF